MLALTELHNLQNKKSFSSRRWITSENATAVDEQGKLLDPAAGVAILLSKRMVKKIHSKDFVGSRIAWVRLQGPTCFIFFVVVYIPHKYRNKPPYAQDTLIELDTLLRSEYVSKHDCVVVSGDLNCQLRRNVQGCTGRWAMTNKNEKTGHDKETLSLMRSFDLFAVDTRFMPERKLWQGKMRRCNATYLPKHVERRPTKLDYFLVSNR